MDRYTEILTIVKKEVHAMFARMVSAQASIDKLNEGITIENSPRYCVFLAVVCFSKNLY